MVWYFSTILNPISGAAGVANLILLILVNNFSIMYRIVPGVGLLINVEQFLKFNTNSAVSVTRACK